MSFLSSGSGIAVVPAWNVMGSFETSTRATAQGIYRHTGELCVIAGGGLAAYLITAHYLPTVAEILYRRNLFGIDLNKTTAEERSAFAAQRRRGAAFDEADGEFRKKAVPESLGILVGAVYLSVVMALVVLLQPATSIAMLSGPLTTITVMLLLGFVDDVLDVRWRYKMLLSMIGTLPLIMAYDGSTSVLLPGSVWQLVRAAVVEPVSAIVTAVNGSSASSLWSSSSSSSTTTDAAGAVRAAVADAMGRGLQWAQERISLSIASNNGGGGGGGVMLLVSLGPLYLLYLTLLCTFCTNSINILAGVNGVEVGQSVVIAVASVVYNLCQLRLESVLDAAEQRSSPWLSSDHQIRALVLLVPFIGGSLALWRANRYPASVFIGDSYTYFAGTVLAVAAVAGVYSKTLLLFFAPQLLNFLLSIPQLFGVVPCPRHRVPRWVPERDVLTNSRNHTLLNLILWLRGDMHEAALTRAVLWCQALTCVAGFAVRYLLAACVYDAVQ